MPRARPYLIGLVREQKFSGRMEGAAEESQMPIVVDIEDLEPAELLLVLSQTKKTGKLSAVHKGRKILIALNEGSIVYAAQPAVRERLGSVLINRGLISEEDLQSALEIQREEDGSRLLGTILVDMGAISHEALREVICAQFEEVVRELMSWDSGVMVFNRVELVDLDAIHIDPSEVILGIGFETDDLLAKKAPPDDSVAREKVDIRSVTAEEPDLESVAAALAEISASETTNDENPMASLMREGASLSVSLTAEMTLAILGTASEVANRGVLLLVYPGYLSGIGGFGEGSDGQQLTGQEIRVPRHLKSVFNPVVESGEVFRGRLESSNGNSHFVDELGGASQGDVVIVPLMVSDQVVAILYADGGIGGEPMEDTTLLESVIAGIGRTLATA